MFNLNTWKDGEANVQAYMKKHGYKIVYTNYSCVGVELDIVAIQPKKLQIKNLQQELKQKLKDEKDLAKRSVQKKIYQNLITQTNDILVITEVKSRSSEDFGHGYEAIDLKKRAHLIRGAEYLRSQKEFKNYQVRFDVASVDAGKIEYIENAFSKM